MDPFKYSFVVEGSNSVTLWDPVWELMWNSTAGWHAGHKKLLSNTILQSTRNISQGRKYETIKYKKQFHEASIY